MASTGSDAADPVCTPCTSRSTVHLRELVSSEHTLLMLTSDEPRARQLVALFRRPDYCDRPNKQRVLAGCLQVNRWMSRIFNLVVTTEKGAQDGPRGGHQSVKAVVFENRAPLPEPLWFEKQAVVPFQAERYTTNAGDAPPAGAACELALPGLFALEGMDQGRLQKQVDLFIRGFSLVSEDSSAPLAFVTAMFRRLMDFPCQRALVLAPEDRLAEVTDFIRSFAAHLGWLSLNVSRLEHGHPEQEDYEVGVTSRVSDLQAVESLGLLFLIEADQFASRFQEITTAVGAAVPVGVHTPGMQPQFASALSSRHPMYASVRKPSHSLHRVGLYHAKVVDEEDAVSLLFQFLDELVTKHELKLVIQCRSPKTVKSLATQLCRKGFEVLSSDDPRSQKFWRLGVKLLVTTFSRETDVHRLNILYELPETLEEYVRYAGHDPDDYRQKLVINLVRPEAAKLVKQIKEDMYGCTMLPLSPSQAYDAWADYFAAYPELLQRSQKSLDLV